MMFRRFGWLTAAVVTGGCSWETVNGNDAISAGTVIDGTGSELPYDLSQHVTDGSGNYEVASGTLPAGLSLSTAGTLSGVPTDFGDVGDNEITVTVGGVCESQTITIVVISPI